MLEYPPPIRRLIAAFKQLPTVGPRSAERLALHMLKEGAHVSENLVQALNEVRSDVRRCKCCGFFSEEELCSICSDEKRDSTLACVVEEPSDVISFERSGAFTGKYHVLGGCLSPLDGIGPEELGVPRFLERAQRDGIKEVILGLNADAKGETTSVYLARELKELNITVTRLATGISVGGSLEFADSVTLSHALQDRKQV